MIEDVIKKIDVWKDKSDIKCELISISSNYVYKVTADSVDYILRLDGEQIDFLGLDRKEEVRVLQKAAQSGIGPKIYSAPDNENYIVSQYIAGSYIDDNMMKDHEYIEKMAAILKVIHSFDGINRKCTPYYMLDRYLQGMNKLNVMIPDSMNELLSKVDEIQKRDVVNERYTRGYCHNDFFAFNMIDTKDNIYIIDWELSGVSNIFFDLSTISFSNMYTAEKDKELLKSYFGYYDDEHMILLEDMKYMNMLRDIGWLLLHSGIKKEHSDHFYNTALTAIDRVQRGHLHFRCNCYMT